MNSRVLDQIRQTLSSKRSNLSNWLVNTPTTKQDLQSGAYPQTISAQRPLHNFRHHIPWRI
jgi:hypothetical protein